MVARSASSENWASMNLSGLTPMRAIPTSRYLVKRKNRASLGLAVGGPRLAQGRRSAASALRRHQREHRPLRIEPLQDPSAVGRLHRSVGDLPAVRLDALDGRVDGVDVEIIKPERRRRLRRLGKDAAALAVAGVENVVDAHWPHVEVAVLLPAELARIERES